MHIAVNDVEEAARDYHERFGLEVSRQGTVEDLGIKNAIIPVGDAVLELIEPIDPSEGPLGRFLGTRGEGVYMMALEVDDVDQAITELESKGVRLLAADPESRAKGGPVFVHPKSTHGVLIELVTRS